MRIRTAFIGAAAIVLWAASAGAQGKTAKPVVVTQAVLKSMDANKSKSKTPLGARIGIGKRPTAVATMQVPSAPTSVKEIKPISKKN